MTTAAFTEAVARHERAILAAEGPYTVAERYFANGHDADIQRRWEAEKRAHCEARAVTHRFQSEVLAVACHLKGVIRECRSHVAYQRGKRHDALSYVSQLAKDVLSRGDDSRSKCVEQVTALVLDIAERGELGDAVRVGLELAAAARIHFEEIHRTSSLTLIEAHLAEQHAQGLQESAETAYAHERSHANAAKYLAAHAVYLAACEQFADVVRRLDREAA